MKRQKLFATMLASTMLTTSMLSPIGNVNVLATEVVEVETTEPEVEETELANVETEVSEVEETEVKETEVEQTEVEETEVEQSESEITETKESEVAETEDTSDKTQTAEEESAKEDVVTTEVENVSTETSTEANETETIQEEMTVNNIIANDETGIPDAELYRWMLVFVDSNDDNVLTVEEAEALEELRYSWSSPISSIKGIEYFKNLKTISFDFHWKNSSQIKDISPLTNLTNLTSLDLSGNQIEDISLLTNLTNLTSLDLGNNQITDISALSNLKNLTTLNLSGNNITDISILKELTKLESLSLGGEYSQKSQLSDISVLTNLTNLTNLSVSYAQVTDVRALTNLTNLTSLSLSNNKITDISPLADLALKHDLRIDRDTFSGNNITTIGDFPEYVIYNEDVEIRYLAEKDKQRIIQLFGLNEYDGKVICMDSKRQWDSVYKSYPYGDTGYGYDYDILRKDNGDLALGKILREEDNNGRLSFFGSYGNFDDAKLTISFESDNVWIFCCGDVESSGLNFTDKVEKTKIVEPFAKKGSGATISKSFEREYEISLTGKLKEQDIEVLMDYFSMDSFGGSFAIIPTEGSKYKIDFEKSSYGKDELAEIQIRYSALTRNEDGSMEIDYFNNEWYSFKNGKLSGSDYYTYGEETQFLTKGDIGTDVEDCEFYIPAMDEKNDEVLLISIRLYTLNGGWSGNFMVYNDEKTFEVCDFVEVKEPEEEQEESKNESYEVTLPSDNLIISKEDFSAILEENKTKDIVIKSNNGVSFTFKAGTMSAVDGVKYDFSTELISDFAKAGDLGSAVTKDNFITRINFGYEGKLPAEAYIRFYVGTDLAGKTLHYSRILENGFKHLQSVTVDAQGYITVKQDSCSDYIVTTEKLGSSDDNNDENQNNNTGNNTDNNNTDDTTSSNNKSPNTNDTSVLYLYVLIIFSGISAIITKMRKKVNN